MANTTTKQEAENNGYSRAFISMTGAVTEDMVLNGYESSATPVIEAGSYNLLGMATFHVYNPNVDEKEYDEFIIFTEEGTFKTSSKPLSNSLNGILKICEDFKKEPPFPIVVNEKKSKNNSGNMKLASLNYNK